MGVLRAVVRTDVDIKTSNSSAGPKGQSTAVLCCLSESDFNEQPLLAFVRLRIVQIENFLLYSIANAFSVILFIKLSGRANSHHASELVGASKETRESVDYYDGSHANQDATLMVISCFVRKKRSITARRNPFRCAGCSPEGKRPSWGEMCCAVSKVDVYGG